MSKWIYENSMDNKARFVLGESGTNPLICFGVNPSTAEPDKLDPTLRQVKARATQLGFDGWLMFNLYPQRATKPTDLHSETEFDYTYHARNLESIRKYTLPLGVIKCWSAWGNLIETRGYLAKCLADIQRLEDSGVWSWFHIGPLSKKGHPHHPLYLPKKSQISDFNISEYVGRLTHNA